MLVRIKNQFIFVNKVPKSLLCDTVYSFQGLQQGFEHMQNKHVTFYKNSYSIYIANYCTKTFAIMPENYEIGQFDGLEILSMQIK